MTRDAKLYILMDKDWKPLAEIFQEHKENNLKLDISIYQLMTSISTVQYYAILTLSDKADKIVEEYGAKIADNNDCIINDLLDYDGEPLFGDKSSAVFLNKTH